MITTALLALLQTTSIFFAGYFTAKLIRRYQDEKFLEELHSRLLAKIAETAITNKEILDGVETASDKDAILQEDSEANKDIINDMNNEVND